MADAILDRLVHNAQKIELKSELMRENKKMMDKRINAAEAEKEEKKEKNRRSAPRGGYFGPESPATLERIGRLLCSGLPGYFHRNTHLTKGRGCFEHKMLQKSVEFCIEYLEKLALEAFFDTEKRA